MNTRISILAALAVVASTVWADEGADTSNAALIEPARSDTRTSTKAHQGGLPALNHQAANRALRVALGALPAEEKESTDGEDAGGRSRIGVHRPLPSGFTGDVIPHLVWVSDSDDQRIAVVEIRSEGAVSVRIAVQATLPTGTSVQIFDTAGEPRGPAYTREDFELRGSNAVWLPSVAGDTLIAQITVPSDRSHHAVSFTVTKFAHRYARLMEKDVPECRGHVDVPCVTNRVVRDIADAIGLLEFEDDEGSYECTGTLLNDVGTPEEFEPYLLTAHHCISTEAVARSVVASWFWQGARCRGGEADERLAFSFRGAELLTTSLEQDSTLLRFIEELPGGLFYAGSHSRAVRTGTSVFSVHHPNGFAAQAATGRVADADFSLFVGDRPLPHSLEVNWRQGLTEGGSSGAGLFDGYYLIGILSGGLSGCTARGDVFGSFRDFDPHVSRWIDPQSAPPAHVLPAVPGAAAGAQQGFIRILNRSPRAGEVTINAIDDTGWRAGPITLYMGAFESKQFNSQGLEQGNPSIGLMGGVGVGTGMWRVELHSTLKTRAYAYIRTPDGFLTSMHQLAESHPDLEGMYTVPFFNPASNLSVRSYLRVINPNSSGVDVLVRGLDGAGRLSAGSVSFWVMGGTARVISAQQLEEGDPYLTGSLGDGVGKWELIVAPSAPVQVMSLLATRSGHLSNVSQ